MDRRHIGRVVVDWDGRRVSRNGSAAELNWRGREALEMLVAAEGRVVDRDSLAKRLWPDTLVDETSLTKVMSQLRKTLQEVDPGTEYVETIPRVGYRLAVAVQPGEAAPPKPVRNWRWAAGMAAVVLAAGAAAPWLAGWWEQNRDAEKAYAEGMRLVRKRDYEAAKKSVEEFRKAIELNPGHARAWAAPGPAGRA